MDIVLKEMPQEFTSAETNHMSKKVPLLFTKVGLKPNTTCVDFGGGKHDQSVDYLAKQNVECKVYDLFNRTKEHNEEVIKWVAAHGGVDYVCCSNVLNVIKEPEVRQCVCYNIYQLLKCGGTVYFTTFEGTKDGIAQKTKKGWQENRKTETYLEEIRAIFPNAKRKGLVISATK